MYLLRDKEIHKLMLSFDINEKFAGWDTEKEAKDKMEEVAWLLNRKTDTTHVFHFNILSNCISLFSSTDIK
jgi:hypothetical protein